VVCVDSIRFAEVPGFPRYRVSEFGVVQWASGDGWRPMSPSLDSRTGYYGVSLSGRGRRKHFRVHDIVLLAFIGPRPPGMQCRHLNGQKADNRLSNLAWGTPKENAADRTRHGNMVVRRGEQSAMSRLTEAQAMALRQSGWSGKSGTVLAREFGVSKGTANRIVSGQDWSHLPRPDVPRVCCRPARLTADQKRAILLRLAGGESQGAIARDMGINQSTISRLARGGRRR
jgi:DNA-directed RNA polymerase specialized sigma24 family protein